MRGACGKDEFVSCKRIVIDSSRVNSSIKRTGCSWYLLGAKKRTWHLLRLGQTDRKGVASGHKLNLRRDLRWAAKLTCKSQTCFDLRGNMISTDVSESHRKAAQVQESHSQTESD